MNSVSMMPSKGKEPANASHVLMGHRIKWLGWSGGIKRRVALSCDAGCGARRLVPTTLRQFSRDRPAMGSHVAGGGDGGPDHDVGGSDVGDCDKDRQLLETMKFDLGLPRRAPVPAGATPQEVPGAL